ncbi:Response regulator [hydrothermal vent metagenome]|uniref:Response regulator n=1 Tax=hydrothermal vent metagenome TaxID=652676 RepID=A0A1W1D340_9ZZZZ
MNNTYNILIVDDIVENIQVVMSILQEENYSFSFAKNGKTALDILQNNNFDLVLLDIMMPGLNGFEVCKIMKSDPLLQDIPVIFLTAKADIDSVSKGFEVGGVDYISKPFHSVELLSRVKTHLELYRAKQILKQNNLHLKMKLRFEENRMLSELEQTQKEMIFVLTELIESISDETGQHIRRVADYSRLLAQYHEALSDEDVTVIYHASPMHDIGKIAIPPEILHKKGKLTQEEFEIIKTHTTIPHKYFKYPERKIIYAADIIASQHHEKYDGSGYPKGLKGEDIHIYGRIVALADVFDALTHKRVYKDAWSAEEAAKYIIERSGKQFDPYLVKIFQEHLDEFIAISNL